MTSMILGSAGRAAGATVGSALGGPVGRIIGGAIGGVLGGVAGRAIDQQLFSPTRRLRGRTSHRMQDLAVQSSAYGEMLPIIYGSVRLAGNIIWSQDIKEVVTTERNSSGGGKGGGGVKVKQTNTIYNYYATLAVAICEGPIDELVRIWADATIINQADYNIRLYKGTEEQLPDSLIEAIEGSGKTPAYRGMAYVVFEDFPLATYGNRIPNFTFEVRKSARIADSEETPVEELVTGMVLIPGAGEFVYDDTVQNKVTGELVGASWVQRAHQARINQNNRDGKADGLVALDQLAATCPNVQWVSPVVTWFGDNVDAGTCLIKPGVEFQEGAITQPDSWAVGTFTRATARQITLIDDKPQYGGTPSDASLLRYLEELKGRGYNIMFYPMFFMDTEDKPWRGRVTGAPEEVADFFTKPNGYNAFIMHYANLVKDVADAFVIGSELIGLTSVKADDDSFPAVDALVSLAAAVKAVLDTGTKGVGGVKVTYAADWSEYHHTTGGWYNLDPLWACSAIDMVGIDAYFPLTNEQEPSTGFTEEQLISGWTEGEGYDWYFTDEERTTTAPLEARFAWKNISWWWSNEHVNPDDETTAWVPESKKIWFTEYGFPSVDGCSNQPNVFYDPNSSESHFPHHSRGRVDFRSQRTAIAATEKKWAESEMIERKFLWTWDARPFPFWPDLRNIWADGNLWRTGHWVQGKFGTSSLAAIVADLSRRAGLNEAQADVSMINDLVEGYIIAGQASVRDAIDILRSAYFFDAVESAGQVKYIKRGNASALSVAEDGLIGNAEKSSIGIARQQEFELPQKVDVLYLDKSADYQTGNQHSQRLAVSSQGVETLALPVVMRSQQAKNVADLALYNSWKERTSFEFMLPLQYAYLEPTDVITVNSEGSTHTIRILDTRLMNGGLRVQGVAEDISVYDFYNEPGTIPPQTDVNNDPGQTVLAMLDLPPLPFDSESQGCIRYAACGLEETWQGAVVFRSDDAGSNYSQVTGIPAAALIGVAIDALAAGSTDIFDHVNSVTISLYGAGELESLSQLAILNGANLAKLGDEIIQFQTATLVAEGKYTLSNLLRGRLGTEWAVDSHEEGEEFILIDNNLVKELQANSAIGISRLYKGVSVGKTIDDASEESFTYNAAALKPFSPVHIKGERDGSDNLTITWTRRTRTDGQLRDNVDVPLGESSEIYEVDIMDGSNILRTLTSTTPTAIYSSTDQTLDFGSPQAAVAVKIYQLSEVVGRGREGVGVV